MKKIFLITLFLLLSVPQFIIARTNCPQEGLVPCGTQGCPCEFCDFFVMVNKILDFLLLPPDGIVFIIAALMLVVGGAMFLFGGAKPDMFAQAKGVITSAIIGLVIILLAWIIVNTIITKIGIVENPSGWQWYNIGCQQNEPL